MSKELRKTKEQAFFAAGNGRDGFHSYYESCFRRRVDRLFCIKGGPGTGKSTLMRQVAREGELRGYRVEYYYCSSDADSLDAVLLFGEEGSVGVLDATSPHAFEPTLPGVREEIVDLGQFWDSATLATKQSEIVHLNTQKSDGYRAAYRYLAGAGEVSDILRDLVVPLIDHEKLKRTANRLMRGISGENDGEIRIGLHDSIGMRGRVSLDTYLHLGERICLIEDYYDTAYALMRALADIAFERRLAARVSYHPVLPDRIDALCLEESKTVFVVCGAEETTALAERVPHCRLIDMRRLVVREHFRRAREEIRRAARLREALLCGACDELEKVSRAHFELEKLYSSAMDFAAKERYTAVFCRQLFDHRTASPQKGD